MVTDPQGVQKGNGFYLTDPAPLCTDCLRFGHTNLGEKFMMQCFNSTKNYLKECGWECPRNASIDVVQKGFTQQFAKEVIKMFVKGSHDESDHSSFLKNIHHPAPKSSADIHHPDPAPNVTTGSLTKAERNGTPDSSTKRNGQSPHWHVRSKRS